MNSSTLIRDHSLALFARCYFTVGRLAPHWLCRNVGRQLGSLAFRFNSRPRRIAYTNIKFAYQNEVTDAQAMAMVHRNFQQWGMIGLEWAKIFGVHQRLAASAPAGFEVVGLPHWQAAKKQSRAVLLLGAHFGNWEYAHGYYAAKLNPLNFIVRKIDNPYLEKVRMTTNTRHGVNILYKNGGLKPALKNLRKGQDLVIFADQNANKNEGVESRFFGRRTSTMTVVASMAKKYNLPVVPMYCVRKNNSGVHQIVFQEPLPINSDTTIPEIAQMQNDVIEKMVRAHPDHWLWMHRKWNHYHHDIYKGD